MMRYEDFYKIVKRLNEIDEAYTEQEIACNAYIYKTEYDYSIDSGFPGLVMRTLCKSLVYDMDFNDYEEDMNTRLDIETMEEILQDFLVESC